MNANSYMKMNNNGRKKKGEVSTWIKEAFKLEKLMY